MFHFDTHYPIGIDFQIHVLGPILISHLHIHPILHMQFRYFNSGLVVYWLGRRKVKRSRFRLLVVKPTSQLQ